MRKEVFNVYILRCSTGELYVGCTGNLEKRVEEHNRGRGSRFTRSRIPVKLVYSEECRSRKEAVCKERQLKRKTRREKLELIGMVYA
ncbi:MAG: GIY-YIG nuclease family protein [Candidatus Bathyarchaeia archaeon]